MENPTNSYLFAETKTETIMQSSPCMIQLWVSLSFTYYAIYRSKVIHARRLYMLEGYTCSKVIHARRLYMLEGYTCSKVIHARRLYMLECNYSIPSTYSRFSSLYRYCSIVDDTSNGTHQLAYSFRAHRPFMEASVQRGMQSNALIFDWTDRAPKCVRMSATCSAPDYYIYMQLLALANIR